MYYVYSVCTFATACDCGVAGSIPTGGALEVWPWTFGFRTAWLINKSAGPPPFTFALGPDSADKNAPHFHGYVEHDAHYVRIMYERDCCVNIIHT